MNQQERKNPAHIQTMIDSLDESFWWVFCVNIKTQK